MTRRIKKINSLLREEIATVIQQDVQNPSISALTTVISVDTSKDLRQAKVYISIFGNDEEKQKTIDALQSAAGYIAVQVAKQVVLRYFPKLYFKLDQSIDQHMHIDSILQDIQTRESPPSS